MADARPERRGLTMLLGRGRECAVMDRLLEDVRAGRSGALVLRGEPGVGKTALLEHATAAVSDLRVVRAVGVESEMELAFAALHQLCAPMLDRLDRLPGPQRDALATTFGFSAGPIPNRFLVGLAVLGLLSEAAEDRPLLCVVDDAQWLDHASAQALAFAARRLQAEPVLVVFAAREPGEELRGLPELVVEGLPRSDARALLRSVLPGPMDDAVREQLVAESRGNPLALLELPRGLTPAQLAGGFGLPGSLPGRIEHSFVRRLTELPADTRRLLLLAAADPVGDPTLVWRAAEVLDIGRDAGARAQSAGLLEIGTTVRFRHPLVRSAVYRDAMPEARHAVHAALAEATDPDLDPDRRAWHRAHATAGPDEDVARELERSAGRAQRRGGPAAAAAFLVQAAALTPDRSRRAERELGATQAMLHSGALEPAQALLAAAVARPLDEIGRARVDLLRGRIAWAMSHGSEAPPLLLSAAKRLEPLDLALARQTYLDAFTAAITADRLSTGGDASEIATAVRAAPAPPKPPGAVDELLDGLAVFVTDGRAAARARLQGPLDAFVAEELPREESLRWIVLASHTALVLWDHASWQAICARQVDLIRDAGALSMLPYALTARIFAQVSAGELAWATALVEELDTVAEATRSSSPPQAAIALAASRGRETETLQLVEDSMPELLQRGEGMGVTMAQWALGVLYNGLGRYEEAVAASGQALADAQPLGLAGWARVELIEAAVRSGNDRLAAEALEGFSRRDGGTDWALGVEARSRALLTRGGAAEDAYHEAIERLERSGATALLARTRLLYGEWLRRERRRREAREHLRDALEMLTTMGMEAFAARAERELLATGEHARRRVVDSSNDLTAQEAQIARLARDGLSNPEIGARLFISPRTVQYHLHKVFTKLDITSRSQLEHVLSGDATPVTRSLTARRCGAAISPRTGDQDCPLADASTAPAHEAFRRGARKPARYMMASFQHSGGRDGEPWPERLRPGHPRREQTMGELREVLLGKAIHELSRRRGQLRSITGPELEDLAHQAANDALVSILARLEDFRGLSRFTTWAGKFVMFEVSCKVARHAWRRHPPGREEFAFERLPDILAPRPGQRLVQREQLSALSVALGELTDRQREVFVAIALNDVPSDVLAGRLGTNRNAIYKNLFDARRSLRARMAAAGHPVREADAA